MVHTFTPMQVRGPENILDRTYNESADLQWVRETYINAIEAGATEIAFGFEWQAIEKIGVYRRIIADNGCGMSENELQDFFNTIGGSGKPVGGEHQNFGIGAKTSLLPWNPNGLAVLSWKNGQVSMIIMGRDANGAYGLRDFVDLDEYGDPLKTQVLHPKLGDLIDGIDWVAAKPAFITDHGTLIVLLGSDQHPDTIMGDPKYKNGPQSIQTFLNKRVWEVPTGTTVRVTAVNAGGDRSKWPTSFAESTKKKEGELNRTTLSRLVDGALYFIRYPKEVTNDPYGKISHEGVVNLLDGTKVMWYLWSGGRPVITNANKNGFIGVLYQNELYDQTSNNFKYRQFGISENVVRNNVTLIIVPNEYDRATGKGVLPNSARSSVKLLGSDDLPFDQWGAEFAAAMPQPIKDSIAAARSSSSTNNSQDMKVRLENILNRFEAIRFKTSRKPTIDTSFVTRATVAQGIPTGTGSPHQGSSGTSRVNNQNPLLNNTGYEEGGPDKAAKTSTKTGFPSYLLATLKDVGSDNNKSMMASWVPNDPTNPNGVVLLAVDHPVIDQQIKYFQDKYYPSDPDMIRSTVLSVYGEQLVAKITHSQHLTSLGMSKRELDDMLRSPGSLTMSLLGLFAEDSLITKRLQSVAMKANPLGQKFPQPVKTEQPREETTA